MYRYQDRVLAYINILGFKEIIKKLCLKSWN
jgi:hypothetical protein